MRFTFLNFIKKYLFFKKYILFRLVLNNLKNPNPRKPLLFSHAANPNPPAKPVSPRARPPCLVCGWKATPQPAKPASALSSFVPVGFFLGVWSFFYVLIHDSDYIFAYWFLHCEFNLVLFIESGYVEFVLWSFIKEEKIYLNTVHACNVLSSVLFCSLNPLCWIFNISLIRAFLNLSLFPWFILFYVFKQIKFVSLTPNL